MLSRLLLISHLSLIRTFSIRTMTSVTVIPTQFKRRGQEGDFKWMIENKEYSDALFIFNDNVDDHKECFPGGGNAAIRPYNKYNPKIRVPQSAGIPTGNMGGFSSLDEEAKLHIDGAVQEIKELIQEHGFTRVYYSADEDGKLGTSIFVIGDDVRDYITKQIQSLSSSVVTPRKQPGSIACCTIL